MRGFSTDEERSGFRRWAAVAAMVLLAGCSSDVGTPAPRGEAASTPASFGWDSREASDLEGTFFLLAGENLSRLQLFRLDPPHEQFAQVGEGEAVSAVTGCPSDVVVSRPDPFADRLARVRGEDFAAVGQLGTPSGQTPSLSPGCRLAFVQPGENSEGDIFRVKTWRPGAERAKLLWKTRRLGGAIAWGPDGHLALSMSPFPPYEISIRRGRYRRTILLGPRIRQLNGLLWAPSRRLLATQTDPPRIFIINPTSGRRERVDGWEALAIAPDGQSVLVASAETLGVMDLVSKKVEVLGKTSIGDIYDAAWLP